MSRAHTLRTRFAQAFAVHLAATLVSINNLGSMLAADAEAKACSKHEGCATMLFPAWLNCVLKSSRLCERGATWRQPYQHLYRAALHMYRTYCSAACSAPPSHCPCVLVPLSKGTRSLYQRPYTYHKHSAPYSVPVAAPWRAPMAVAATRMLRVASRRKLANCERALRWIMEPCAYTKNISVYMCRNLFFVFLNR